MICYEVETHQYNRNHPYYPIFDDLCYKSKNVYNSTLYNMRQEFFATGKWKHWTTVYNEFVAEHNKDYYALNTKVSKGTMRIVNGTMKGYFGRLKEAKKNKSKEKVGIPGYLDSKEGRQTTHFEKDALSFVQKKGYIKLAGLEVYIKSKKTRDEVKYVRVVPFKGYFEVQVGYRVNHPKVKRDNKRYASVDLGLNNLMAVTSNIAEPFIINGRPLKSMNQYYNKQVARLKSELPKGQYTSHRIQSITRKRHNKVINYLNQSVCLLMNYLVRNQINTLYVGYNKGWKQNIEIGTRNNQNFVSIPYYTLKNKLEYQCKKLGIQVVINEESYTSKCSFIDKEDVKKQDTYLGRRVKRGLFKSTSGELINADINGSLNILKKSMGKKWSDDLWEMCLEQVRKNPIKKVTPQH